MGIRLHRGIGAFAAACLLTACVGPPGVDGGTLSPPGNSGIGRNGGGSTADAGAGAASDAGVGETVPGPPTDAVATPDDTAGSVDLAWSAPADLGGGVASYLVTYGTAGAADQSFTAAQSPATISNLQSGFNYAFIVRAVNAAGTSAPSATAYATPF